MTPTALKERLNSKGLTVYDAYDAAEQEYYCFENCDNCDKVLTDDELNAAVVDGFARVCAPCRPIVEEQLQELMEGMAQL